MATIKETLDSLSKEETRRLQYAFEQGIGQFIIVGDKYIGVNIKKQSFPHLTIEQQVGVWSVGKVAK